MRKEELFVKSLMSAMGIEDANQFNKQLQALAANAQGKQQLEQFGQLFESVYSDNKSDEDIMKEFNAALEQTSNPQSAAKGGYLKKLRNTSKKCSCGCDMKRVLKKGGVIEDVCVCGCGGKLKKKKGEDGMEMPAKPMNSKAMMMSKNAMKKKMLAIKEKKKGC